MTILKEIYYSTYLPNDISCIGNDITVGCRELTQFTKLHSPHWISSGFVKYCSSTLMISVVFLGLTSEFVMTVKLASLWPKTIGSWSHVLFKSFLITCILSEIFGAN